MNNSIRKILENAKRNGARVSFADSKPKKNVHRESAIEKTPNWAVSKALIDDDSLLPGSPLVMLFSLDERKAYGINNSRPALNFINKYIAQVNPQYEVSFRNKSATTGDWVFVLSRRVKARKTV